MVAAGAHADQEQAVGGRDLSSLQTAQLLTLPSVVPGTLACHE